MRKQKDRPQQTCAVIGCERNVKNFKHMLCNAHTVRFYRNGTPGIARIRARRDHLPFKHSEPTR